MFVLKPVAQVCICLMWGINICLDVGLQLCSSGCDVLVTFVGHMTYIAIIAHIVLILWSRGLWHCVMWQMVRNVSEECTASIFRVDLEVKAVCSSDLLTAYHSTQCHNPEDGIFLQCRDLWSHVITEWYTDAKFVYPYWFAFSWLYLKGWFLAGPNEISVLQRFLGTWL
jgi:hypothetical protein